MSKFLRAATLMLALGVVLSATQAQAQAAGSMIAGDIWSTYLPTNVGKTYYENPEDPNSIFHLFRVGNLDRQWTTPSQMYPGGENIHIPWKQDIEMIEYSPGINHFSSSSDPRASDYLYGFQTAALGAGTADNGAHWTDADRHQQIYNGTTPTNLGIDVIYRTRQYALNHANMNDFVVLEMQLTNTGRLDADGDGTAESTSNRINALVLNMRTEPINSMSNSSAGRRGASGWFTGPTSGYDASPDPDGNPWDVPVVFTGPSPGSLTETTTSNGLTIPWAADGGRLIGNTMNRRKNYYDIHTGMQWISATEGTLPASGSAAGQTAKKTIFDSHPTGEGAQRGWFTSVTKGYGNNDHNPWENHILSSGTFYEDGGKSADRTALTLRPDPNWFDTSNAGIVEGDILSFIAAVKPEGERGQPMGDMKYLGTYSQNWEQGNPGTAPDGSDTDWTDGYAIAHGFDGDHYVGIGPFSLEVGESMTLTFVEYGGFRLQGARRARAAAQYAFDNNWVVPRPPATPDVLVAPNADLKIDVKWDNRAESAGDFAGYKIYRSTPFPRVDSQELGIRMVDRYHEQTVANPTNAQLAAFGVPNNPNISSGSYTDQTPNAWGPYHLIANVSAAELGNYLNGDPDSGNFKYKFTDDSDLVSFGFTYYYYVAAYDNESGSINGWPYTSLETHRNNINGASGEWEGAYWWTTASAFYPDASDLAALKDIGAPFILKAPLADAADLQNGSLKVRVLPNPYKRQALHDVGEEHKILFINLPTGTKITILDVSGQTIDVLEFNGTNDFDGTLFWDMFSKDGIEVTSGLYIYVAEYPGGAQTGHFAILQ